MGVIHPVMSLPEPKEIKRLAIGDLRSLVESLLAGCRAAVRAENAALREEVARLKGLPPRPKLKPSGMEKASQPRAVFGQAKAQASARRQAGSPGDRRRARAGGIGADRVALQVRTSSSRICCWAAGDPLSPGALADAGRADDHRAASGRDRRWLWPCAAPVCAGRPCPGPGHQRAADRPAQGIGIAISKRQVVRLLTGRLDAFVTEDGRCCARVWRARPLDGAVAPSIRWRPDRPRRGRWIRSTTPAPSTPGATASPPRSATAGSLPSAPACRSPAPTSSTACGAGHNDFVVDEAAVAYMRRHHLAGSVIDRLASHPQRSFPNQQAWVAHLETLGIAALEVLPDPVKIATQGAMWGAIHQHGLLRDTHLRGCRPPRTMGRCVTIACVAFEGGGAPVKAYRSCASVGPA